MGEQGNVTKGEKGWGLGFRDLESLNYALLMKQLWRILKSRELLVSKVLMVKYLRNQGLMHYKPKRSDSYLWKSLCSSLEIFKLGILEDSSSGEILWKQSPSGTYSVKSGYALASKWSQAQRSTPTLGESSNRATQERFWSKFWRMGVPSRAKFTVRRLYYNALPVGECLRRRGVLSNNLCVFCGYNGEDAKHIFISCWWVQALWRNIEVIFSSEDMLGSPKEWLWNIFERENMLDLRKIMVGIWVIWMNRNLIYHGKQGWCSVQCNYKISSILEQFNKRTLIGLQLSLDSAVDGDGKVDIYCDGSWSHLTQTGGAAAVAMCNECILFCQAKFLELCESALEAEILGVVIGLKLAAQNKCRKVVLHVDSTEAIWALQSGSVEATRIAGILKEGLQLLEDNPNWGLSHVFRENNIVTDFMAKKARMDKWNWEFELAIPRCLPRFSESIILEHSS